MDHFNMSVIWDIVRLKRYRVEVSSNDDNEDYEPCVLSNYNKTGHNGILMTNAPEVTIRADIVGLGSNQSFRRMQYCLKNITILHR